MFLNRGNIDAVRKALQPLAAIADAYDANELDDEARKFWGGSDPDDAVHINQTPPEQIELFTGRGGNRLLTLQDCLTARDVLGRLS